MHRSRLPLVKWILAFHLMCSSKKGISALQLKRQLGIGSYQTAWHLCHRIRYAMTEGQLGKLGQESGAIESDEAYFGGKPRRDGEKHKAGRGTKKIPIMVLIDRESGRAKSEPIVMVSRKATETVLKANVDETATILTDDNHAYKWTGNHFKGGHLAVNHTKNEFSRRDADNQGNLIDVHVNHAESFFALLRRGHIGAFHKWGTQHIHRYCAEFDFRWSHRKDTDFERTLLAIQGAEGKRLTYDSLPSGSNFQ